MDKNDLIALVERRGHWADAQILDTFAEWSRDAARPHIGFRMDVQDVLITREEAGPDGR